MSTVTLVRCDGCGKEGIAMAPKGIRITSAVTSQWAMQQAGSLGGVETQLYVVMGDGSTAKVDALDYCSAECAAKHLSGAGK